MAWHPYDNIASFTTSDGEVYIFNDFVPSDHAALLEKTLQPAPFIHDPLREISGNAQRAIPDGNKIRSDRQPQRAASVDSLDDILGSDGPGEDEDDFVVDDDGAGYALGVNGFGKRTNGHLGDLERVDPKRRATSQGWKPELHLEFQPGSTPWRGNRRYLCQFLISPRPWAYPC